MSAPLFFFSSGFYIKAISGRSMTQEEMLQIGSVILHNQPLVRQLYVLGWDTLIIEDVAGKKRVKWPLKDFTNIGFLLG